MNDRDRLQILEARLADMKARLPAHSVRPATIVEMEELEDEIEELRAKVKQEEAADA